MAGGSKQHHCLQLPDLVLDFLELKERNRMARLKELGLTVSKLQCLDYCLRHGY